MDVERGPCEFCEWIDLDDCGHDKEVLTNFCDGFEERQRPAKCLHGFFADACPVCMLTGVSKERGRE